MILRYLINFFCTRASVRVRAHTNAYYRRCLKLVSCWVLRYEFQIRCDFLPAESRSQVWCHPYYVIQLKVSDLILNLDPTSDAYGYIFCVETLNVRVFKKRKTRRAFRVTSRSWWFYFTVNFCYIRMISKVAFLKLLRTSRWKRPTLRSGAF